MEYNAVGNSSADCIADKYLICGYLFVTMMHCTLVARTLKDIKSIVYAYHCISGAFCYMPRVWDYTSIITYVYCFLTVSNMQNPFLDYILGCSFWEYSENVPAKRSTYCDSSPSPTAAAAFWKAICINMSFLLKLKPSSAVESTSEMTWMKEWIGW